MVATIEHDFQLVSEAELDMALKYVAKRDFLTLNRTRLRAIANNAGKTRKSQKVTPRVATSRALQGYHNEYPGVRFSSDEFEGYVHAVAKIMAERSPRAVAKRRRKEEAEEILAISHNIENIPPIDPEVSRQLLLGLTGPAVYE